MKKQTIYDEIMALTTQYKLHSSQNYYADGYTDGHNDTKYAAAQLDKKYDDEIERIEKELNDLRVIFY